MCDAAVTSGAALSGAWRKRKRPTPAAHATVSASAAPREPGRVTTTTTTGSTATTPPPANEAKWEAAAAEPWDGGVWHGDERRRRTGSG